MKHILIMILLTSSLCAYNVQHLQNLQQALDSQEKNINISHVDLRGLGTVLQGTNLSGVQACGVLFSQISKTFDMIFAGLIEVPEQKTDLSDVNFSNADLTSANFAGAVLHGVNFSGADLAYVNFSDVDLTGAKLDKAKNLELAMFCNAIMPDGEKPKGSSWQSSSGKIIQLNCTA